VLATCPPDAGLQKRANFNTLIVGLAKTGGIKPGPPAQPSINYDYMQHGNVLIGGVGGQPNNIKFIIANGK
jgi:hypothetical protein